MTANWNRHPPWCNSSPGAMSRTTWPSWTQKGGIFIKDWWPRQNTHKNCGKRYWVADQYKTKNPLRPFSWKMWIIQLARRSNIARLITTTRFQRAWRREQNCSWTYRRNGPNIRTTWTPSYWCIVICVATVTAKEARDEYRKKVSTAGKPATFELTVAKKKRITMGGPPTIEFIVRRSLPEKRNNVHKKHQCAIESANFDLDDTS